MTELLYYLWLEEIKGCGSVTAAKLIRHFGSAQAVYETDDIGALIEIEDLNYAVAFALITDKNLDKPTKQAEYLNNKGINYITYSDETYPSLLKEIHDPPGILYYNGKNVLADSTPSIAVVGARKATPYGINAAETISFQLAKCGINIISGLASGIDGAAHKGALAAGGCTIGVLGCGIDIVYPMSNKKLYQQIIDNGGMVLTEFAPETEPLTANFPRRNRIISGLTYGTLVIEAAENSGSLITAKYACEQGREVYAVPGNINNPQSAGCNLLIKDGAKLVTCGEDVLEDMFNIFRPMVKKEKAALPELTEDEKSVFAAITRGIQTSGDLAKQLQKPVNQINGVITMLELKGMIAVDMGKIYVTY